jgi:hypothetical protein
MAIVNEYPDPSSCVECEYKADKPKTLSIHVALVPIQRNFISSEKFFDLLYG